MSKFKKILIFIIIVLVGIQFIPTKRNESMVILKTDFTKIYVVPENIQIILKKSCFDCHSNNTNYPWYNKIQPINWMMESHINNGKKELNFSEFGSYSKRKQKSKLKAIINQIKDDEMPLSSYTLIHRDARLSVKEKKIIKNWMGQLMNNIE